MYAGLQVSLALRELFHWVLLIECLMKSWDSEGNYWEGVLLIP